MGFTLIELQVTTITKPSHVSSSMALSIHFSRLNATINAIKMRWFIIELRVKKANIFFLGCSWISDPLCVKFKCLFFCDKWHWAEGEISLLFLCYQQVLQPLLLSPFYQQKKKEFFFKQTSSLKACQWHFFLLSAADQGQTDSRTNERLGNFSSKNVELSSSFYS